MRRLCPLHRSRCGRPIFEKFGALFFPFKFKVPQLFVLCEVGVDPTTGMCLNNLVSDIVSVTNNRAGEGVVAMISEAEGQLVVPVDFPVPPPGSKIKFLKETGAAQVLTPAAGLATVTPTDAAGPVIRLTATSDLETTSTTSDILVVASQ
jgi:hypothetical protein